MVALSAVALLVYTFGAFAYGAILLLWIREWGRSRWGSPAGPEGGTADADRVSGALFLISFLWFVLNAAGALLQAGPPVRLWPLQFAGLWLAFAFPPLIMHVTWGEVVRSGATPPHRAWRRLALAAYPIAGGFALATTLAFLGVGDIPLRTAGLASSIALGAAFVCAAVYAIALTAAKAQPQESPRDRQSRRWWTSLFVLMIPLFVLLVTIDQVWPDLQLLNDAIELVTRSLPLVFMFVGTYLENRFQFFDLFIKRGVALAATIIVLASSVALMLPFLQRYDGRPLAPWAYAVVLLPVVTALPWVHGRIGALLDRRWLGRRFTAVEAVTRFLGALRSATNETQLVASAQEGLGEIFSAPVIVRTHARPAALPARFEVVQEVPARLGDDVVGWFLMGRRASEAPYFSEDIGLLRSLADVFASVLHNLQLRMREQEQEHRAQELSLHASRSELKALRAQINPHFLFNALNAIAGLIPREPDVADRTIEKLAEVFRYALRGADTEWAVLEEELDFARAYLDVEQARFGSRLQARVRLAEEVRAARVPTMMVQTLVENAVKHGAAAVRDHAVVSIEAHADGRRVCIAVSDNGPGFDPDRRVIGPRQGGYGLANIRQRLDGYFGSDAALTIARDPGRGLTVASLVLPFLTHDPPQSRPAVLTERRR